MQTISPQITKSKSDSLILQVAVCAFSGIALPQKTCILMFKCNVNVKSFLSHVDLWGGADLRFCSHRPNKITLRDHGHGCTASRARFRPSFRRYQVIPLGDRGTMVVNNFPIRLFLAGTAAGL